MTTELPTKYDPKHCEAWYSRWEEAGYFSARRNPDREPFTVTIPPPNVTGELHMGHALQHTIHDNVIRRKRMQGYETLCLPGTDHAGIATQIKVEEKLAREEGKTRYEVGREGLIERIWAWRETYGDAIYDQLRKLGCSYDWDRSRFTLDDDYSAAVLKAFGVFHERGWIYRGTRMINWCPKCGTVISDLETEERLTAGKLWHIRYAGIDGAPDVTVATTRPETMLGDTGVAVHPTDRRWQEAVGAQVMVPLAHRPIPIVADEYADPEMGSGAVKITPAHDPNDYEVGARHDLEQIVVIGFEGSMTEHAGDWSGLDRYECRKQVLQALDAAGALVQVDEHEHAVPHHDKCGTVIEPLPMEQWFMNMDDLAAKIRPQLQGTGAQGQVGYEPDRFRGYALEWLDNIRDWALSRQIWWGHRIPAWYCLTCSADGLAPMRDYDGQQAMADGAFRVSVEAGARPIVGTSRPAACPDCGGEELVQDPDVLDTWFSSALWPFATLGWPEDTEDLKYFHPTDLMITGRDILHLWVLRMIMTAAEFVEEIPFKQVLIHPTIMTKDGKRMSKSLGTGLNPLDLVSLYGADATRYSLLAQCGATQDIRFDAEIKNNVVQASVSAETGRNFCNKLWNASRYVLMNVEGKVAPVTSAVESGELADRWILSRLAKTILTIDDAQETFRFSDVTRALHDFLWRDYCDWYIELAKPRLLSGSAEERARVQGILVHILEQALRLMHPIMPFLTEEIWQQLPLVDPGRAQNLMIAPWPTIDTQSVDAAAEQDMAFLQQVISAARTVRSELGVPQGKKVQLILSTEAEPTAQRLRAHQAYLLALIGAESIEIGVDLAQPPSSGSAVIGDIEIFIPLAGLIDTDAEGKRLRKESDKMRSLIQGLEKKLSNKGFLEKAPQAVVEKERLRIKEYGASLQKLESSLEKLDT